MQWIYLSPHLDDAAYSCGGLIWEQAQAREPAAIWTVCAGDPPPGPVSLYAEQLHARWKTGREAVSQRRAEDLASCQAIGATPRHFSIPDCIYRRSPIDGSALYNSDAEIFGELHPEDRPLVEALRLELAASLPAGAELVVPLALSRHVDHLLARAAAEGLDRALWYYADYPYVLQQPEQLEEATAGWHSIDFPVSEYGLQAWEAGIAAHASQISTFWPDIPHMKAAIRAYHHGAGGVRLWRKPASGPGM